ncbi:putative reticulocyte-binding protein 2 like protein a [Amylocarpus encephaloides]|uniref:Reticulocyte-binding protein 2 like protein a n=1 Tax=Amylocarpus encephaloides TaxID=45428 RepID=A0A9P7YTP8_9HELO|nr:putative reticulocyte-binding protein 2 like protein a [Amylocarpus encephaloides]
MVPHKKHVNSSGQTLLARACLSGKLDIAKQRYEERPQDLNEPDHALNTPLHVASINGYTDVVKFLLGNGCTVDVVNDQKDTPLHDAIENGHVEVVRLLFNAGANPNKPNRHGDEPLDLVNEKEESGDYGESDADTIRESILAAKKNNRDTRRQSEDDNSHFGADPRNSHRKGARHSHLDVLNILFAMGGFDPDPPLADGVSLEQATPLLAAIGRDAHLKVIELILGQDNFDPTRRIKGQTYFEIAKKRAGPNWQEEEKLLKDAFEQYEKSHKSSPRKPRSPGRRRDGREANREASRKVGRVEDQQARSHKRSMSSPKAKENDTQKGLIRSSTGLGKDGQVKRGPGRPRKENLPSATASDPENVPSGPSKQKSHVKRSGSELGIASENEMAAKPRRKLVCAKELRDERKLEKQRRTSVASTASGISIKDKRVLSESKPEKNEKPEGRLSPNIPRLGKKASSANNDPDTPDRQSLDKDRARSIKRDDSKDRITAIRGESPVKSHRNSATPPRSSMQEVTIGYGVGGGPLKRRKLDGDESRSESTANSSPELRNIPLKSPLPNHEESVEKAGSSIRVKTHSVKKQNGPTDDQPKTSSESKSPKTSKQQIQRQSRLYEPEAKKSRKASEEHAERIEKEKEKAIKRKEEEAAREAEAAKVKKAEEQAELERVERANKARLAREEAAREEEAKRQKEEAEKKERQRILEVDAHNRAMEEQRVLYLEQEKIKREEQEKRRTLALEQQRAERARLEEQKRLERLSRLPLLLRWFDIFEDTKNSEFANLFRWIDGYRYDTIRPEATGWANAREQWMLNTSVSILLGEKDLHLSRYTAWERIPLSYDAKRAVWRAQNGIFTLREPSLAGFRKQFPITSFQMPPPPPKWKQDPDTDPNQRFTPQPKIFIRGQLVKHQDEPMTKVLTEPPTSDNRVPRRELVPVYPTDPDYEEICKRQGLRHLLLNYQNSSSTPPPLIPRQNGHVVNELTNGITPPSSVRTKSINGGSPTRGSLSEPDAPQNQSVSPTEVIPPALG